MVFIDLTKAFDSVSGELPWDVLSIYGCPEKYIRILRLLHDDMFATIMVDNGNCEPFQVKSGVKQGCIIAPILFIIFVAAITHLINNDLSPGIGIAYRTDGTLFNLVVSSPRTRYLRVHSSSSSTQTITAWRHSQNVICNRFWMPSTVHIRKSDWP